MADPITDPIPDPPFCQVSACSLSNYYVIDLKGCGSLVQYDLGSDCGQGAVLIYDLGTDVPGYETMQ